MFKEKIINMTNFILYKTSDNKVSINVQIQDETVWLTQEQMAELFDKSKKTISEHIRNIYLEGELTELATMRKSGNSGFSTSQRIITTLMSSSLLAIGLSHCVARSSASGRLSGCVNTLSRALQWMTKD